METAPNAANTLPAPMPASAPLVSPPASMAALASLAVPTTSLDLDSEIARWTAKAERDQVRARETYREMQASRQQLAMLLQRKKDEETSKLNSILLNFHSFLVELHFAFSVESILIIRNLFDNARMALGRGFCIFLITENLP